MSLSSFSSLKSGITSPLFSAKISFFNSASINDKQVTIAREMGLKGGVDDIFNDEAYGVKDYELLKMNYQERAKIGFRKNYPLTGYTRGDEANVSIIGKLKGYDPNFTSEQIDDLKNFINESKALGIDFEFEIEGANKYSSSDKSYRVDEFIEYYSSDKIAAGIALLERNSTTVKLLDSDMSVDEFKIEWAKHALKERFGINLDEKTAKNAIEILNELNNQRDTSKDTGDTKNISKDNDEKFKPMQITKKSQTYKDTATDELKSLYGFIKSQFDSGKSLFEILENLTKAKRNIKA